MFISNLYIILTPFKAYIMIKNTKRIYIMKIFFQYQIQLYNYLIIYYILKFKINENQLQQSNKETWEFFYKIKIKLIQILKIYVQALHQY